MQCQEKDSIAAVTDGDALNLDYITVAVSAGLSVGVITIAALLVFIIRRICRSRNRPSSQQLADDISEKAGKEDVCSVIVPAGEDGYARRPTSVKAMDSNYINVEVNDDGEVKVDKRTIGTGEENEGAIKPRGTDAPKATSDEGTETVLYTNSLKVREIMHGIDIVNSPNNPEETLRSRGVGSPISNIQNTHIPEMHTNIDNDQTRHDFQQEGALRSRGQADLKKIFQTSHSLPQMYTNFDNQEAVNGYLVPITETKFQQGHAHVIHLNGTTNAWSDFQEKPDAGAYIYVDSKATVPRNIAGLINSVPEHGTYTNVLTPGMKTGPPLQEPPGWYEELDFTRPAQMYNEIES